MRPETTTEFVIATLVLLAAGVCAVLAKMNGMSHAATLAAFGAASLLVTVYFGARHLRRASPYTRPITQQDWVVEHQDSHRGVVVRIRASVHQRGKYPKVEFRPANSPYSSTNLQSEVNDDGDVEVFHDINFFTPPAYKESIVVIRA